MGQGSVLTWSCVAVRVLRNSFLFSVSDVQKNQKSK